ncbi:MAG: NFACT family protein [Chloroflexota bacterium]|nr:NFACT family protein [Chloroflexota bacterium]
MFDAITLAAVTDELNERILRGRVQEIVQLDALSFGFEIYAQHARQYLFITAHPDDARVHLVSLKLRGPSTPPSAPLRTPLLLLLRKYAEGAFVDAVAQLPHERVLKIRFDHAAEGVSTLVVETIGKYSNLILVDAGGVVIDALKRVPATINRARVVLPNHAYVPPPPQAKLSPSQIDAPDLARVLAENRGAPLRQVLVRLVAGVSPLLAREVAFRAAVRTDAPADPTRVGEILATLAQLSHAPWQPTITFEDDEPSAFAPYPITHSPNRQSFESISAAIEAFYGTPDSYAAAKEPLRAQLADARDKLARKRDALAQSLPREGKIERLRVSGETILAYAARVTPGQEILLAETEIGRLEIPLNPTLSAVKNAQKFFKEYHRAKDAAARVPALFATANAEVEYAEQMLNDLELAENRAEIDAVILAAREGGLITAAKPRTKAVVSEPRVFQSGDGFTILVGKNARQNEEITFRRAKPDDLWLHARDVAGAHVVILRAGRTVPDATVQEAAALAAQYSQARGNARVDVVVAPRKNVHRVRGGRAGMVTVRESRVVQVVR